MAGMLRKLCGITAVLLLTAAVHAEPQLVDDFESYMVGTVQSHPYNVTIDGQVGLPPLGGVWDTESDNTGNIKIQGTSGVNQNLLISTHSGGDDRGGGITDLTNAISDTESGVLFFRFRIRNQARPVRTYLGMHHHTGSGFLTSSTNRGDRVNAGFALYREGTSGNIEVRTTNEVTILKSDLVQEQWYNAWISADNATDTFDLYIKAVEGNVSGQEFEIPDEADKIGSGLPFGLATTNPLVGAMFPTYNGAPAKTDVYIDDIYWDGDEGLVLVTKKAQNPAPANRAVLVPIDQVLSWDAPDDPNVAAVLGYDVYLDPNQADVAAGLASKRRSTGQTERSFDAAGLLQNEILYYWRVDARIRLNDPNQTQRVEPGRIWSFTTVSLTPVITLQPVNQVRGIKNGKPNAQFIIEAANAATYQWRKDGNPLLDGGNVSGVASAVLSITNVTQADEGQYSCVVSNGPGNSVTSETVWLEYARQTCQWDFEDSYISDSVIGGPEIVPASEPNAPSFDTGKIGLRALKFAGDWAMIPVTALPKAGTELTVAFWAKSIVTGRTPLYASTVAAPQIRLLNVHIPWSSNIVYFDISNPVEGTSTSYDRVGSGAITVADVWEQWIFTKNGETGTMRIYRNGQLLAEATNRNRRLFGAEQFFLGKGILTSGADACFDGLLDNLRIYNYSMNEVEAAYLYADSSGEPVCVYPNEPVLQAYDFNDNCQIDVGDLEALANNWLYDQLVP